MAENFGIEGRGGFYDATGAIRDSVRDEKVKVLKTIPPIEPQNLVRGQFRGYLQENGVAKGSDTETFAALKLEINSWRWKGVPFYIRAGKYLPVTCTEIVGKFRKPPTLIPDSVLTENTLRLRLSPEVTIAMGMMDLAPDVEDFSLESREMVASHSPTACEMDAYERLLGAAMKGDATLFARQDYVEEAWRIVDPMLKANTRIYSYSPNTWGPKQVELVTPPTGWVNPSIAQNAVLPANRAA